MTQQPRLGSTLSLSLMATAVTMKQDKILSRETAMVQTVGVVCVRGTAAGASSLE